MPNASEASGWPAWPWLPWTQALAPQQLTQPINPGWIFASSVTVNARNSSAPETERDIVAEESYGRQIGRISDALALLIAERPEGAPPSAALKEFAAMRAKIEEIKAGAAQARVARLIADLERLRRDEPAEFTRVMALLRGPG
jgi:hypothetical protein